MTNPTSEKVVSFDTTDETIDSMARQGYICVPFRVFGYWSHDPITLYVQRKWFGKEGTWEAALSHSSGGRDTDQVENDLDAATNFGVAMIIAAGEGKRLAVNVTRYEKLYAEQLAIEREAEAAKQRDVEAQIASDGILGEVLAKRLMTSIKNNAGWMYAPRFVTTYKRGFEQPLQQVSFRKTSRMTWYINNHMKSEADVLKFLTESSHRTNPVYEF